MASHAAVGVDDDLAPSQPGIAHGTADDEASSRIDVVLGVGIQKMLGNGSLDNLLKHFSTQSAIVDRLAVLSRNHDGIHTNRLMVRVVFNCYLGLAVRTEEIEGAILASF